MANTEVATRPAAAGGEVGPPLAGALTRSEAMGAVGQALSSQAVAQVSLAMQFALAHPRNEDQARGKMAVFTKRYEFAEKAVYTFPRGKTTVRGAGVVMAKELAKVWRNIQSGSYIVADTDDSRTVRCWAWDVETNHREEADVTFNKLIYRKDRGWFAPDERDMLELSNRMASKGVRNCIISVLPWDYVQDALKACIETVREQVKKDPEEFRKTLVRSFAEVGVSGAELTEYVGFPLDQLSKHHNELMVELRGIYSRIRDGETIWAEVLKEKWEKMGKEGEAPTTAKELRDRVRDEAASLAGNKEATDKPPPEQDPPPQGRRAKKDGG